MTFSSWSSNKRLDFMTFKAMHKLMSHTTVVAKITTLTAVSFDTISTSTANTYSIGIVVGRLKMESYLRYIKIYTMVGTGDEPVDLPKTFQDLPPSKEKEHFAKC